MLGTVLTAWVIAYVFCAQRITLLCTYCKNLLCSDMWVLSHREYAATAVRLFS